MKTLFANWDLMRVIRVIIGASFIGQGIASHQTSLWLMGSLFTAMAVLNVGCFGSSNCGVQNNTSVSKPENSDEVTYEEIK